MGQATKLTSAQFVEAQWASCAAVGGAAGPGQPTSPAVPAWREKCI